MEKIKKVRFHVYGYNVHVVYTDDLISSRDKQRYILGKCQDLGGVDGLHSYNEDEHHAFVFFTPETSAGTIAHECSHAITRMFKYFGGKQSHEHFEYHLGYLVDKATALKTKQDRKLKSI